MDSLNHLIAGNELWRLGLFALTTLGLLLGGKLARILLDRAAQRHQDRGRGARSVVLRSLGRAMLPIGFALAVYLTPRMLNLPLAVDAWHQTAARVVMAITLGYAVYCLVDIIDYHLRRFATNTASKVDDMLVPLVGRTVRVIIWLLIVLQVTQTLSDKPVTSLLAGLGVGGLAVALAAQETIKNFFGSLVIIGDKPFEIGDRVVVDALDGTVLSVGFRSTRVRTLEGAVVTLPNSEIVNKCIHNLSRRPFIRHVADIGIVYGTPPEKVRRATAILREILAGHEGLHPDYPPQVFFTRFNDWSLNLRFFFWYHPADYWAYLAFSERVNQTILERFTREGIDFAFPSQTLYINQSSVGTMNPAGRDAHPS